MLPGCNGYEVSRMLKEWMDNDPQSAPFPIMLLTARKVDTRDREKFIAIGESDRFTLRFRKPATP
jgi:predicted methyltransferase